jgi:Zn-dependent peptidase ImmA (M78 family)/transcriptional regulator with XRE-family HTH domain
MIGTRIHHARLAAGLSLAALGERVGVTHTAIHKYESGLLTPGSSQLLKLAQACSVRVEYFFRTHEVKLLDVAFRRLPSFGKLAQEALLIRVAGLVEKRIELLGYFPTSPVASFALPEGLPARLGKLGDVDALADRAREAWNLGVQPIGDLTDVLESLGILVVVLDEDHLGFSGLQALARAKDGRSFPVVAVSSRWSGDRQRFTLAHELGHLLLNGRLEGAIDAELACDRFAGAFLAPSTAVIQLLGRERRGIEWQELYGLKREYGLSMAMWLLRAKHCEVITDPVYRALMKAFVAKGWRTTEPGLTVPREVPRLFEQLVYRALGEQRISAAKAAELLGIPLMRFYQARQLESLDAVAHQ